MEVVQLYKDKAKTQEIAPITDVKAIFSNGTSLIDFFYPVGTIYETVNASFDPNVAWGGTWIPVEDRFLIGASSNYPNESLGGEASHTLTVNEMPSHNHFNLYSQSGDWTNSPLYGVYLWNIQPQTGNLKPNSTDWGATDANMQHRGDIQTGYTGGGASHNNMPPYYAVYMWKRTA